jgi:hypothetical protein
MACVALLSVLHFHIHVDRPNIHPLLKVSHNAFKHCPSAFGLSMFVLKHAELRNDVDVFLLG